MKPTDPNLTFADGPITLRDDTRAALRAHVAAALAATDGMRTRLEVFVAEATVRVKWATKGYLDA
jgi:hypothetical protein